MAAETHTDRNRLALRVVELARALVLADNHFLAAAVGRMPIEFGCCRTSFSTDGTVLHIDSQRVCDVFVATEEPPVRSFLHTVLHCLFLHPFVGGAVDAQLWNLACDIAVERVVAEAFGFRSDDCGQALADALDAVKQVTGGRAGAERIYRELRSGAWADYVEAWEPLFASDDHGMWYAHQDHADTVTDRTVVMAHPDEQSESGSDTAQQDMEAAEAAWRKVAKSLAVDLQTYSKESGEELSGLVDDLVEVTRERVDYESFLRQFAVPGEVLKVSDEEFDYVFYTYGLKLYRNLPLIEPLEYRDQRRVREFAIVIDTSGSVWGEDVRRFVASTFDVLKSTEAFFEQVHVRIIQCDSKVLADDVISNLSELEQWGASMHLRGGGSTDFRPAFEYVDRLVAQGTFENLGGLLYFTDGEGTYPDWMPAYKVAFVFRDHAYRHDAVPPWATHITLDDEALGWLHAGTGSIEG
ncbi:MAG: hypothetical protein J5804_03535 [Eggerthellaceae bacterium]|nr:hypothetical protein [Eggerthellaceae bacterium]